MTNPDWLKEAEQSGLTRDEVERELKSTELEDSGAAVIAQFRVLRESLRRHMRDEW